MLFFNGHLPIGFPSTCLLNARTGTACSTGLNRAIDTGHEPSLRLVILAARGQSL